MKKFLLTIVFLILLGSSFVKPQQAEAYLYDSDRAIKGTLHIDESIAGKQMMLHFIITDSTHAFNMNACSCTITIAQHGKLPYTQKFSNATYDAFNTNESHIQYIFPQTDTYAITLTGKPTEPNAFQPFTLHWDFEVKKEAAQEQSNQTHNKLPYIVAGITGLFVGVFVILFVFQKKLLKQLRKFSTRLK